MHFTYQGAAIGCANGEVMFEASVDNERTDGRTDESVSGPAAQFAFNACHRPGTRASVCAQTVLDM